MDRFIIKDEISIDDNLMPLLKSNVSEIYIALLMETDEVICYSPHYGTKSFFNSDYESFLKCNYLYELFRSKVLVPQELGDYHSNYFSYAENLSYLISLNDKKAIEKGVWHSLIEEMKLGVI